MLRFRRYKTGDLERTKVQEDFLRALFAQKKDTMVKKILDIYKLVGNNIKTNLSLEDILNHSDAINLFAADSMETIEFPGVQQNINGAAYFIADTEKATELFSKYFSESPWVSDE